MLTPRTSFDLGVLGFRGLCRGLYRDDIRRMEKKMETTNRGYRDDTGRKEEKVETTIQGLGIGLGLKGSAPRYCLHQGLGVRG